MRARVDTAVHVDTAVRGHARIVCVRRQCVPMCLCGVVGTHGKGAIFAAEAMEMQGKGTVLDAKGAKPQNKGTALR